MIPSGEIVSFLWDARHLREGKLSYRHLGTENNWYIIEITELEDDIEEVTGIDNTGGIMNDESDACKRTLPRELYKIFI